MIALATGELSKIGIVDAAAVLDATVLRMEKTYQAYFGTGFQTREPEVPNQSAIVNRQIP